jgi:hypothetical protein
LCLYAAREVLVSMLERIGAACLPLPSKHCVLLFSQAGTTSALVLTPDTLSACCCFRCAGSCSLIPSVCRMLLTLVLRGSQAKPQRPLSIRRWPTNSTSRSARCALLFLACAQCILQFLKPSVGWLAQLRLVPDVPFPWVWLFSMTVHKACVDAIPSHRRAPRRSCLKRARARLTMQRGCAPLLVCGAAHLLV